MTTLVEFLRARLDEDAAEIAKQPDGEGEPGGIGIWATGDALSNTEYLIFGKARALADVEAKRKILDEHFGFLHPGGNPDRACRRCSDLRADDDPLIHAERWLKLEPAPCPTVRLLALPYAAHPDYDQAWRP